MSLDQQRSNHLARMIQDGVPLCEAPFAEVASALGESEGAVLGQLEAWQSEGMLREISAVLEGSALGYESALVAGKVATSRLDEVAEKLNGHPTITHNYERDHDYNVWFTIAVPPEMGLDATLRALARLCDVDVFHPLRRTATFKIGVNFDLEARESRTERREVSAVDEVTLDQHQRAMMRALQRPLPLSPRPFAELAASCAATEAELLTFANKHLGKAIRRYVATFRHRKLGVKGNGMVVWAVPPARLSDIGPLMASEPEVSHCYARDPIPGFPYTLYSMIHGKDEASCLGVAARIDEKLGGFEHRALFSTRERKKVRLRYFLPELDAWWAEHGGLSS